MSDARGWIGVVWCGACVGSVVCVFCLSVWLEWR